MRLLLVEDEHDIADPLKKVLEKKGFAVDFADEGKQGLQLATTNEYDCILLDLNLPGMDGIDIAWSLRNEGIDIPILMLTARSRQSDIWVGFENGTDDYLVKPFDLKELILRINALIKRNSRNKDEVLTVKDISLEVSAMKVTKNGKTIDLNNKEFGILEYLLRYKGTVINSEALLEHVWDREIDSFTQTVKTNIKTLRQKIDPEKKIIRTIRSKGYVIH